MVQYPLYFQGCKLQQHVNIFLIFRPTVNLLAYGSCELAGPPCLLLALPCLCTIVSPHRARVGQMPHMCLHALTRLDLWVKGRRLLAGS
jgi:hypothetical protein